jgi:hypothetical protein
VTWASRRARAHWWLALAAAAGLTPPHAAAVHADPEAPRAPAAGEGAAPPPHLQLDGCLGLPRAELRRAMERELSGLGPLPTSLIVTAVCEDAAFATIRVSRADDGELSVAEREVVLGEVATELRPRLVSIIAAELAQALPAPSPAAPLRPFVATPPAPPPALRLDPALPKATGAEDAVPRVEAQVEKASPTVAALAPRGEPPWQVALRPGVRIYKDIGETNVYTLNAELELPRLIFGVQAGFGLPFALEPELGSYERELPGARLGAAGRFLPYLLGVTFRHELYCHANRPDLLCVGLRLEGGMNAIRVSELSDKAYRKDTRAAYGLAAIFLEGRAPISLIDAGLWIEIGAAEGSVFRILGYDEALSYGGLAMSAGLSVRWPR